jgi:hypothetical protein
MKQDNEIDKLFKDKLENSSIPDIPQAYLDDLNKRLDAINPTTKFGKFRTLFGMFSLVGVAISLVIYFTVFNSKSDKLKNDNKNISVNSNTIDFNNDSLTNTNQNNNNNQNNEIAELKNNESEQVISATNKSTTTSTSSTVLENKTKNGTPEKRNNTTNNLMAEQPQAKTYKKIIDVKSVFVTKKEQLSNVPQDNKVKKNKAAASVINAANEAIANKKNKSQSPALAEAIKNSNVEPNNKKDLTGESVSKIEDTKLSFSGSSNKKDSVQSDANKSLALVIDKKDSLSNVNKQLNAGNSNLDSLKKASIDTLALAVKGFTQKDSVPALKPLSDSSANVLKGVKSIQLLIGAANVNSIFTSKNANYDAKRKAEESTILVFDASVLMNYTKNKFVYSFGINVSQWGENIKYTATIDSVEFLKGQDTTYTTVQKDSVTFDTVSTIHSIYGNKVSSNESTVYNGKNKYTYLSIPFLFGYKFGNNLFSIIPKIGGVVGIPISSKGYYVSQDLKKLVQEKARSLLFNVQLSVDLQKKIGSYASICVSPFVNYNALPLIHSENTFNRYYSYGIQIGASYIIH